MPRAQCLLWSLVMAVGGSNAAQAQSDDTTIALIIAAGRPLEVVLAERVSIKRVGQPITATLVEPLYAYDRIVVPAGTKVIGHVARIDGPSRWVRTRAMLSGDFTPARHVELQFDQLLLEGNEPLAIHTVVKTEMPRLKRASAPATDSQQEKTGTAARAEQEAKNKAREAIASAKQQGRDVLAEITQPGRMARVRDALVQRLPYHPQVVNAGTGYQAELLAPVEFGHVTPIALASPTVRPAPSSVLSARLVTTLDSSKTPRGTPLQAIVTEPVFSADHQLIFPEGTALDGEVTFAKAARRFHRNGQLRFLFERVHPPSGTTSPLLASLQSVQSSGDDHVALDDEGGATLTNSKTRFIAPALAVLALRANVRHDGDHLDPDGDGHVIHSNDPGALGVGGFLGLGLLGAGLSQVARPVGIALSAVGAVRTIYTNVLGRGRDVRFPADSLIQLQLAPGPSPTP